MFLPEHTNQNLWTCVQISRSNDLFLLKADVKGFSYFSTRLTMGKTLKCFHSNAHWHRKKKINARTNYPIISFFFSLQFNGVKGIEIFRHCWYINENMKHEVLMNPLRVSAIQVVYSKAGSLFLIARYTLSDIFIFSFYWAY